MTPLFLKKETKKKKEKEYNPVPQKIIPYTGNDPEMKLVFDRVYKMCDKCNQVYPEHYFWCIQCGSGRYLREFRVHNNMSELEKNFK